MINLDFLQLTLAPIQLTHLGLTCLFGVLSILLSKTIWNRLVLQRLKKDSSVFQPFIKPLISYVLFMVFFLPISLAFYQHSNQLIVFNIVFQWSLFILGAHYIYVFFKSRLLFVLSLFMFFLAWYFNRISLLKPSLNYVNQFSLKFGAFHLTPWSFLKSIFTVLVFLWGTSIVSFQVKTQIRKLRTIKANTKEILSKTFDIFIYFFAALLILNILGINLSTLTVIGGALGVGIGFGLQKITSNFISGLILLFEKSIKINDLVEMDGGIYGFIRRLGSRFTLVETLDGKEVLIPNEDFITSRVTNWTFSNKSGRVEVKVGVSYNSDIKKAQQLILEAAEEHPRCLKVPPPKCFLREFGDSSVNFLLLFFVDDVTKERWEPESEVMMAIWDKLKENNIEIPFPQLEIHIKPEKCS